MLCSAQPGKSGSNWLDRLRSSKGIPTSDDLDLDLDSFLLRTTHSHSLKARAHNRARAPETHDPPMSSVLAELFNMGQSSKLPEKKKCPRKQTNPKFLVASSSSRRGVVEAEEEAMDGDAGGDDNDGHELMRGFSCSEVTVIDTSCPGWKVHNLVFRKNNVWKVRERKAKSINLELGPPSKSGQYTKHERRDACKDTQDDLTPPPKKRKDLKSREWKDDVTRLRGFLFPGLPENQERKTHLSF